MSTHVNDLASRALVRASAFPQTAGGNVTGATVDLLAGDGACFAVQQVGAVDGVGFSLAGKVTESDNGTAWTDVAGGAFAAVTAAQNVQTLTFRRSKRYVRYEATLAGTAPSADVAAVIGQIRKQN